MTATVIQIRDYHLKRQLEKDAASIMSQVIDYREVARLGGPGGIDDLMIYESSLGFVAPDKDPA